MLSWMVEGYQREVRAARASLVVERLKPQPDARRISELEGRERRALEALILSQMWWGPYWAVIDLWSGGNSGRQAPCSHPDEPEHAMRPTPPPAMLMAAE